MTAFIQKWGSLEVDAFRQALQQGNPWERLFALFALGHLAPANLESLLAPFLQSAERKERWASTIALGHYKDERLFAALQGLLLEEMDYQGKYYSEVGPMVVQAVKEAAERFGSHADWEKLLDSSVLEAYHRECADAEAYEWFMRRRYVILWLFEDWRDARMLPTLRQALLRCQELRDRYADEKRPYVVWSCLSFYHNLVEEALERLERLEV